MNKTDVPANNSNNTMVHIDIFIAIYMYNSSETLRYKLTESIFCHYKNIQSFFQDKANITFTILGSEGDLSKNLVFKYFDKSAYHEYWQDPQLKIIKMLDGKINKGMELSFETGADVICWVGSNDYLCYDYFEQIINYYNSEKMQLYGIDNYFNGKNAVYYCKVNDDGCDNYWHNGKHTYCGRSNIQFAGGTIAVNRKCLQANPHILKQWDCDEGKDELNIMKIPNMDKMTSNKCFFLNIKIKNYDITPFESLKQYNKTNVLALNKLSNDFLEKFNREYVDFNSLCNEFGISIKNH